MTCITYKGGTMASDSALWTEDGDYLGDTQKIFRLSSGALYGASGDADDRELRLLLSNITHEESLPSLDQLRTVTADLEAMLVLPSGAVWAVLTGPNHVDAELSQRRATSYAIGRGSSYALACMDLGGGAKAGVKMAASRNGLVRGPVQWLDLDDARTEPQIEARGMKRADSK